MFISILPAGKGNEFSPVGMIKFFPFVGLMLGMILIITDSLASLFWPDPVVAVIDVICLVVLTGAFHLDGLGDAADGLFSHRSRERALEIMKDSRTGMMGLVVIFCTLFLKIAGLYALKKANTGFDTALFLLIVPAYARGGMLFGIRYLKYGRESTGTGFNLFEKKLPSRDFAWLALPVILSFFTGFRGIMINLVFAITVFLLLVFYQKKMKCITGDMLGAMTEVTESLLFLTAGMGILV